MSFRRRLTFFFVIIVMVPMVALAILVRAIADDSREGKADARLSAGLDTAIAVYQRHLRDAGQAATKIGRDRGLGPALEAGTPEQIRAHARRLASEHDLRSLVIRDPSGDVLVSAGSPGQTIATAERELEDDSKELVATLAVSVLGSRHYVDMVTRLTGRDVAVVDRGDVGAASLNANRLNLPGDGESKTIDARGKTLRAATVDLPGEGPDLVLFGPVGSGGFFSSSPLMAIALGAFLLIAVVFVVVLLRAVQAQVEAMHDAAHRVGEGDFSQKVPVVGADEMAGLATEFNRMSERLEAQMTELRRQRTEIGRSVRRIGEAFASGLDRGAQLRIIAETAIAACDAEYGRISLGGREGVEAQSGLAGRDMRGATVAAEKRAQMEGELVTEEWAGVSAIAAPIHRTGTSGRPVGAMSVARVRGQFTTEEREVFLYLTDQASSAIENLALHELVAEQAVTDELTGLANQRAFRNSAQREAERAERFGHPLSMLILDIDDFKWVNDTYGHLQGDEVLRRVAGVLGAESRAIDQPARYGGEEFTMTLPETGSDGAFELAERIRARIESERVELSDGRGEIQVTASVGIATIPGVGADLPELMAAADAALYDAKRAGKNRVRKAPSKSTARTRETP